MLQIGHKAVEAAVQCFGVRMVPHHFAPDIPLLGFQIDMRGEIPFLAALVGFHLHQGHPPAIEGFLSVVHQFVNYFIHCFLFEVHIVRPGGNKPCKMPVARAVSPTKRRDKRPLWMHIRSASSTETVTNKAERTYFYCIF